MDRLRQGLLVRTICVDHASIWQVLRVQPEAVCTAAHGKRRVAVHSMDPLSGDRRLMAYLADPGVRAALGHQHSAFTGQHQPMASGTRSIMGPKAGLGPWAFRDAKWNVPCPGRRVLPVCARGRPRPS